jgi:hypothetical protein
MRTEEIARLVELKDLEDEKTKQMVVQANDLWVEAFLCAVENQNSDPNLAIGNVEWALQEHTKAVLFLQDRHQDEEH